MGMKCKYCTAWADGFNAIAPIVSKYAGFCLSSPDASDVQTAFRAERGWTLPMVSVSETSFAEDMGYRSESGGYMPGISVFMRGEDVRFAARGRRRLGRATIMLSCGTCSTCWRLTRLMRLGGSWWLVGLLVGGAFGTVYSRVKVEAVF